MLLVYSFSNFPPRCQGNFLIHRHILVWPRHVNSWGAYANNWNRTNNRRQWIQTIDPSRHCGWLYSLQIIDFLSWTPLRMVATVKNKGRILHIVNRSGASVRRYCVPCMGVCMRKHLFLGWRNYHRDTCSHPHSCLSLLGCSKCETPLFRVVRPFSQPLEHLPLSPQGTRLWSSREKPQVLQLLFLPCSRKGSWVWRSGGKGREQDAHLPEEKVLLASPTSCNPDLRLDGLEGSTMTGRNPDWKIQGEIATTDQMKLHCFVSVVALLFID